MKSLIHNERHNLLVLFMSINLAAALIICSACELGVQEANASFPPIGQNAGYWVDTDAQIGVLQWNGNTSGYVSTFAPDLNACLDMGYYDDPVISCFNSSFLDTLGGYYTGATARQLAQEACLDAGEAAGFRSCSYYPGGGNPGFYVVDILWNKYRIYKNFYVDGSGMCGLQGQSMSSFEGWPSADWAYEVKYSNGYKGICVYPTNSQAAAHLTAKNKTEDNGCPLNRSEADPSNGEPLNPTPSNSTGGGSSIDLKTGNVYHSQQAGPLTLSYNSLSSRSGPLGTGWTHNFNISVSENSDGSIYLSTADGNRTWYKPPVAGKYYADAKSRDLSVIEKNIGSAAYLRTTRFGKKYSFDSSGRLTSIIDRNDNTICLDYSETGKIKISDSLSGRLTTLTLDGGKITGIREQIPNNYDRNYSIGYNSSGLVSDINDISTTPARNWHFEYFAGTGRISSKRDPEGNLFTYEYYSDETVDHSTGMLKWVVDPNGIKKEIAYEVSNQKATVTERDGGQWIHKYHTEFNVPAEITDPLGNITKYYYYSNGNLKQVDYPDGTSEQFTYMNGEYLESQTDRAGNSTGFTYDVAPEKGGLGLRVTEITDAAGNSSHLTYDAKGNVETCTDRTGVKITLLRNQQGNVQYLKDHFNNQYEFHYVNGQVDWAKDPNLKLITTQRANNIITVTDALDRSTNYIYDTNGEDLLHIVKDPSGDALTTELRYDRNGNIASVTDPLNLPTSYKYNYRGQLRQVTDALGHVTEIGYTPGSCSSCGGGGGEKINSVSLKVSSTADPFSITGYSYERFTESIPKVYKTTITDPLGKTTVIQEDPATRQRFVTDRNQHQVTYTYTPIGKIASITYPGRTVTYDYHNTGWLWHVNDSQAENTALLSYDYEGRVTGYSDAQGFATGYQYDAAGNLKQIIYPDNTTVTYCYDNMNRLDRVLAGPDQDCEHTGQAGEAIYTYYDNGLLRSFAAFNGITTTYSHDEANRLTGITSPVASWSFTLDAAGNRTGSVETVPLSAVPEPGTVSYTYNAPAKNRLLAAGSTAYSYDDEGQLASAGGTALTFDCNHRLAEITDANGTDQFFYDAGGFRIKAIRGGVETRYIYDPWGNLLAEANSSNQITRKYIYGKGLIALVTPTARYCYHFDATGHTIALTDMAGTVVNYYAYEPFGEILAEQETIAQPFKYVGQYGVMAEPSGLYYMRARYYDPSAGRFISEDPLGFGGGDVNLAGYVGKNPLNRIDPLGLSAMEWAVPAAMFISQIDSPAPGPADLVAGAMIGIAWIIDHQVMMEKYAGYKEGKPCPPKGFKPSNEPPVVRNVNSQDFKDFIRWKYGSFKANEWDYIMQKYIDPKTGDAFKMHYWRSKSGIIYHHLR